MLKKILSFGLFLCMALFFFFPEISNSQQQSQPVEETPEQTQREMQMAMQGMRQMGPAMSKMVGQMMDVMLTYLARKETAMKLAAFTRNYYVALVKAGFTKEEALRIVVQSGMPSLGK